MRTIRIHSNDICKYFFSILDTASLVEKKGAYYLKVGNEYYKVNTTGAIIFSSIKSNRAIADIIDSLEKQYGIHKEKLISDTYKFLKGIYKHKVLHVYYNNEKVTIPSWGTDALTTVQIILTHKCNLRCCHCLLPSYRNQLLSTTDYKQIFGQLYLHGNEFVNFSGGEPFVRKDIIDIFKKAVQSGIDYGFNTNGTLIDQEKVDRLKEIPPNDISVSLYGHNQKLHELVTQSEGSFKKSLNAIKLFVNAGFSVTIKTMVTKFNVKHIGSIAKFVRDIGVNKIVFDSTIFRKNDGNETPLKYRVDNYELKQFENSEYGKKLTYKPRKLNSLLCNAGVTRIAIDSDGTVFPCSIFRLPIGNIKRQDLNSILEKSEELHRYLQYRVRDLPRECLNCEGLNYCKICPGLSYNEYSDYTKKYEFECLRTKIKLKCERKQVPDTMKNKKT